jgi:N6-adenosine-specific RNA methylase IME4
MFPTPGGQVEYTGKELQVIVNRSLSYCVKTKRHEHEIEANEMINKISLLRLPHPAKNTRGSMLHTHLTKRHQQPACSCGDAGSETGRLA